MKKSNKKRSYNTNPWDEAAANIISAVNATRRRLTLNKKFEHQKFEQVFGKLPTVALLTGYVAQLGSFITGFKAMSILMEGTPTLIQWILTLTCLLCVEVCQRYAGNYFFKGLVQYGKLYRVAASIVLTASVASVALSYWGSRALPADFIPDPVHVSPKLVDLNAIEQEYDHRISDKMSERDEVQETRQWRGRLAGKDAIVIQQYNADIDQLYADKDAALAKAQEENDLREAKSEQQFITATADVAIARDKQGNQLVLASMLLEVLFWLSMAFSWWYDWRCMLEWDALENQQALQQPQHIDNKHVAGPSTALNSPQQRFNRSPSASLQQVTPQEDRKPIGFQKDSASDTVEYKKCALPSCNNRVEFKKGSPANKKYCGPKCRMQQAQLVRSKKNKATHD